MKYLKINKIPLETQDAQSYYGGVIEFLGLKEGNNYEKYIPLTAASSQWRVYCGEENVYDNSFIIDKKYCEEVENVSEIYRTFDSGAQRDTNQGKIRPDLISPYMLKALGRILADGAEHYSERNWEKGMPNEVLKESASRHYVSWMNDEFDEDHAAKLIFNVMAYIHFRDKK